MSDEAWERFVADVRREVVQKMAGSACVMSVAFDGEPDVKLAVETGMAVLLDKPIVVIVPRGRSVAPGLERIAHAVIEMENDVDIEAGQLELQRKLGPVLRDLGVGS